MDVRVGSRSPEPSPAAEDAARRTRRILDPVLAVAALLAAAAGLARLVEFEYGLDQGIYAVVSDALLEGGAPYRDAWDFKPPGIFAVYALARGLLGPEMSSVRVLEALAWASLVGAYWLLGRRLTGSHAAGVLAGALAVWEHVWLGFWHTAQPEGFGAVAIAWALVAATDEGVGPLRRRLAWAGAGALYGLAALLKPTLGGGILVSAGITAAAAWRAAPSGRRLHSALEPLVLYALGGLAPVAATLAFFAGHGALAELAEALFVFAPAYTGINYAFGGLLEFLWRTVAILGLRFSWLAWAGVALLFLLPAAHPRERPGALHVAGVLAMGVLGVALQGRFFAYHFAGVVPLLALLAGLGFARLVRIAPRGWPVGAAILCVLVWGLAHRAGLEGTVAGGFVERVRRSDDGRAYNVPRRVVARWVAEHTRPGDAIYVWGFEPVLYDLAGRHPASRYVYNAPQRAPWSAARTRPRLLAELQASRPAAILVEHGDVHPGTTGNARDSATALERFPALARLLARDYREAARVEDFTIHLRKRPVGEPRPSG